MTIAQNKIEEMTRYYGSIEHAREAWRSVAKRAKSQGGKDVEVTNHGQIVTDGDALDHECYSDAEEVCPVHGGSTKKIYSFGVYNDAEVRTFSGCKCAVCTNVDAIVGGGVQLGGEITYHSNYSGAHGRATLIKAGAAIANAPFN